MMTHHCHVPGCKKAVPPNLLMCLRHWSSVPKHLQNRVWKTYRRGQEVDKNPSAEYVAAAKAAIDAALTAQPQRMLKIT